jgi:DNA-binding MarR family transcriptional regulator
MKLTNDFANALQQWNEIFMGRSMRNFLAHSKKTGVSMMQMGALIGLHRKGASTVSHISEALGISNAATSQMLERLVQQGLISRAEDPHDRRAKQIEITTKGCQALESNLQARQKWLDDLGAALSPAEQTQVTNALNILITKAHQIEESLDP